MPTFIPANLQIWKQLQHFLGIDLFRPGEIKIQAKVTINGVEITKEMLSTLQSITTSTREVSEEKREAPEEKQETGELFSGTPKKGKQ